MDALGSFVGLLVGSLIGVALMSRVREARLAKRRRARISEVDTKLRSLDSSGFHRRWREGLLCRIDGELLFRPRWPRLSKTIDLARFELTSSRRSTPTEKWWFAGPTVLIGSGTVGAVELGFGSDDYVEIARDIIKPG